MPGLDIAIVVAIIATGGIFMGVFGFIRGRKSDDGVFDFESDYAGAITKPVYRGEK